MEIETIDGQILSQPWSLGPLAAALAKAQSEFDTITRDKTVTVTSARTGKSYTFKYAPLDTILAAVRGPLSKNGLALVQLLDDGALVTSLIHESGASVSGRMTLPEAPDIQGLGSAITYLRRYAIQAVLGIAAEEDDDGNRASGNVSIPAPEQTDDGGLIGIVEKGTAKDSDLELHETPDGWAIGFRLKANGKGGIKVIARDALAQGIAAWQTQLVGQRVTCWGRISDETFTPKGTQKKVTYQVLALERLSTPDFTLPAAEAESIPLPLDEDEKALIAASLP